MKKQAIVIGGGPPDHRFSSGIRMGNTVYISGQGPLDDTGQVWGDDLEQQAELTLENVRKVLEAGGCCMDDCLKVTVYLKDLSHYDRFNVVYRRYFQPPLPARTLVGTDLNWGILVEIDAIAERGSHEAGAA